MNSPLSRTEILPTVTVQVADGSGCLFQPSDSSYSYVLTAKHVIKGNTNPVITRQIIGAKDKVINEKIEIIGTPFRHTSRAKDAAIIKVKKVANIEHLIRLEGNYGEEDFYLTGHPLARNEKKFSFRENKLSIKNKIADGYYEAQVENNIQKKEVDGQSGGPIISFEGGYLLLAGIQARMAVKDEKETHNRIEFMPLSFFDEIIAANLNDLSPLFPPYFASFQRLLTDIFPLTNLVVKKQLIQGELQVIAQALCNTFSPNEIFKIYKNTFLIHGTSNSMIQHKRLWISFLELLSINQLHAQSPLTIQELAQIHKKRKLYFTDSDEWTSKLENIYKSDLSAVEKGGCIVVSASNDTQPGMVEVPPGIVGQIAHIPRKEMNISNTIEDPFNDLRLIHIYKFQRHIINQAQAFANITANNSSLTLQNETRDIF